MSTPSSRPSKSRPDLPIAPDDTVKYSGNCFYVRDEIGSGGMGTIFCAKDSRLRRRVAMKVLHKTDVTSTARFYQEAQILGQLEHPNIVPIHQMGDDNQGHPSFTMKLVKGKSLEDILQRIRKHPHRDSRKENLPHLLGLFVSICNGIAFAHSSGVLHRDLKPENVMIGDYGEVLVMDWGLAKSGLDTQRLASRSQRLRRSRSGTRVSTAAEYPVCDSAIRRAVRTDCRDSNVLLTMNGKAVGTPLYMSPEQACGENDTLDFRSDIYALGAILYQILTLRPPVKGKTVDEVLRNAADGNIIPPRKRAPKRNIPLELEAIAMKALATEREDRYPAVIDLRDDVERYVEGLSVSAHTDSLRSALRRWLKHNQLAGSILLVAGLLLVGLGVFSYYINLQARLEATAMLRSLQHEQFQRAEERFVAAPVFYRQAQLLLEQRQIDAALMQTGAAIDYQPNLEEARLLRAQIQAYKEEYSEAIETLKPLLEQGKPSIEELQLLAICKSGLTQTPEATRFQLQGYFERLGMTALIRRSPTRFSEETSVPTTYYESDGSTP